MQLFLRTFAALSLATSAFGDPAPPPPPKTLPDVAVKIKNAYELKIMNAVRPIRAAYQQSAAKAVKPLREQYLSDLNNAMEATARAGDFESAAAIKREIETATLATDAPLDLQTAIPPTIVFKARVDATDDIIIQDGKLRIHHIDWSKPLDITINEKKWQPNWTGNDTDVYSLFDRPLPSLAEAHPTIRLVKGKGEAAIRQMPSKENGHQLVIRVTDWILGASDFELHVAW